MQRDVKTDIRHVNWQEPERLKQGSRYLQDLERLKRNLWLKRH